MPPSSPSRIETVKVKPAAVDPVKPVGVVAVPKDLPELPVVRATSQDAVTDALPAKPQATGSQAANVTAIETGPASPLAETKPEAKAEAKPETKSVSKGAESKASESKTSDAASDPAAEGEAKSDGKVSDGKVSPKAMAAMTPSEAQALLSMLEKVKTQASDGGELTPELLRQLPIDVARALVSTGIATVSPEERAARAQRMARIVKLPAEILNAHRGRDGIADIPEQDTWVANNGRISIPLPGGGDVTEPGILKEFGLQP
jgi:hypothetical protein